MKKMTAITTFFQRDDAISPGGGRKVDTKELLALKRADESGEGFDEVAKLSARELGETLDP